ncbi:hypothetical protein ZIOFF_069514 [Zingiber officinale]|uniref:Pentatricopeptide repeat-containing protein n=1 Tax=Zingiber officinale TaxID=94328 RepID=A0A8J5CDR4_ZINOF|nr:hypothetical protein ZIOFF_069514 [Zingiber officinale]
MWNAVKEMIKSSARKKVEEERKEPKLEKLPPRLKSTMSARNLFSGKDLLSQIFEFYHELKRMAVESKTPIGEEAEKKEVNNEREVLQEDSCSFMAKVRCIAPCPASHHQIALPLPVHHLFAGMPHRSLLYPALLCSRLLLLNSRSLHLSIIFPESPSICSALEGQMVHALFVKHFPNCDAFVVNSLMYMYVQLDCIDDAVTVFRLINMKDVVSWMTIMGGLVKSQFVDDAQKLFNEIPVRNAVSWTSLIADHAKDGRASEVIGVFKEMMSENVEPDTVAMVAILSACTQLRDLKLGKWLHQIVIDKRIGVSSNLAIALINMYAKGGSIKSARQIFNSMNNKIAPAWNAIIDGYCNIGDIDIARSLFEKMNASNIISFNSMITGYIHGGRLKEALQLFSKLQASGLQPDKFTVVSLLTACASLDPSNSRITLVATINTGRQLRHLSTVRSSTKGSEPCPSHLPLASGYCHRQSTDTAQNRPAPPGGADASPLFTALISSREGNYQLGVFVLEICNSISLQQSISAMGSLAVDHWLRISSWSNHTTQIGLFKMHRLEFSRPSSSSSCCLTSVACARSGAQYPPPRRTMAAVVSDKAVEVCVKAAVGAPDTLGDCKAPSYSFVALCRF